MPVSNQRLVREAARFRDDASREFDRAVKALLDLVWSEGPFVFFVYFVAINLCNLCDLCVEIKNVVRHIKCVPTLFSTFSKIPAFPH